MLRVKLFGQGQAQYFDHPLIGFPKQQPGLLLSYLLLNRHPHSREFLSAIFWSEYPLNAARKCLRNSLWRLRQVLELSGASVNEYLLISEDTVTFIGTSDYRLDVKQFEEIIRSSQSLPGEKLSEEQAKSLDIAIGLYEGDLLESVFDDWCLYDRERVRSLYLNTLNKLMVYYGAHGNYERGLEIGSTILSLDNINERAHRQIMLLNWLSGNRSAALIQYKRCCQILRDELGVPPLEETRRVYEQILNDPINPFELNLNRSANPRVGQNNGDPDYQFSEYLVKKLQHLRQSIDETRNEISQIERLISESISNPKTY